MADLIVLGIIVALIFVRLYHVLGTKPERHTEIRIMSQKDFDAFYQNIKKEFEKNEAFRLPKNIPFADVFAKIPNFDPYDFLKRAQRVFEMVLEAFAGRDEKTLKMLLTPSLFQKFVKIIKERTAQGITVETDLIKIEKTEIKNAQISDKGLAKIVVLFESSQINLLKNAEGTVIEGDENFVQNITDVWTFEKSIADSSPVWKLSSTKKTI